MWANEGCLSPSSPLCMSLQPGPGPSRYLAMPALVAGAAEPWAARVLSTCWRARKHCCRCCSCAWVSSGAAKGVAAELWPVTCCWSVLAAAPLAARADLRALRQGRVTPAV